MSASLGLSIDLALHAHGTGEALLPIIGGCVTSFGDSFVNNAALKTGNAITTYSSGVMVWAEAISQGRVIFSYDTNKGVNGEKASDVNARIASGAAALAASTDVWFYSAGRNDVTQGIDAATSAANIKAGCRALVALGKPVFLEIPNPPRGDGTLTGGQRAVMNAVNADIRAWVLSQRNVYLIDYFADWDDGTGQPKTNYTYDGLHPSRIGAFWAAKRFWTDHGSKFPARQNTPDYLNYNSGTKPFGNLLGLTSSTAYTLTGAGGQVLNASGSLASDYQTARDSGTSANGDIVLSKEAVGDGTFRQVYAMAMTGDYNSGGMLANKPFGSAPTTPAELLGKLIAAEFTVEVVASAGINQWVPTVNAYNGGTLVTSVGLSSLDGLNGTEFSLPVGTYLFRSPPVLVAAVDSTPLNFLSLTGRMMNGGTGTFKVTRPWYGRVS